MSSQTSMQIILSHFSWSLARLNEAIANENTEYYRGAALNRFVLTYDIALEAIRVFAKGQGEVCSTDKTCFKWAENFLNKNFNWENMLVSYKKIKLKPEVDEINKIYNELKTYSKYLSHLKECMVSRKGE